MSAGEEITNALAGRTPHVRPVAAVSVLKPRLGRPHRGRFDQSQFAEGDAGFQKSVAIMGDVGGIFPTEIPQVPLDSQAWKVAEQDLRRLCRFLGASELRQRRRPYREHLKMIGIQIQGFARPGQRRIILSHQVVAERVQGRPFISGVAVAALHGRRKQFNGLPMLADHEVSYSEDAAGAHVVRVQLDRPLCGFHRRFVIPIHRMPVGQNRKRE